MDVYKVLVLACIGGIYAVSGLLLDTYNGGNECVTRHEFMTVIAALNSSIIKEKQRSNIAFVAELNQDIVNPSTGFHIIFDKVKLDIGGNYRANHGVFIAPYPGIYHFAVELSSPPQSNDHDLHVRIMKKSEGVAITFLDDNTHQYLRRTASIVLELDTGDDVWCLIDHATGSNTIAYGYTSSMFSGFIIHPL
ncbi:complement C1q tumor necrosis factor-related protein 4-like [Ostrea edulis]|uniref:complement C1q tumor necrosis factor-related protein 4-like n=1 Tax=Ostrea edulis TaxID=37623 RepID=UPI002095AB23|nr:complement C1q tumor necrosis factor-related protein 4-like [Ostrea edulis]